MGKRFHKTGMDSMEQTASGCMEQTSKPAPFGNGAVTAKTSVTETGCVPNGNAVEDARCEMAERAVAECVFDITLEALRCVPGLGDGTADTRAVFHAVYAAAKTLVAEKPVSYPAAVVSAAMGVAEKFGGPASAMRIAVRDGERAEFVRPLAGGLELSANVDAEEGEFAVSVKNRGGMDNEGDLAVIRCEPGEDSLTVKAYTDMNTMLWGMPAVQETVSVADFLAEEAMV